MSAFTPLPEGGSVSEEAAARTADLDDASAATPLLDRELSWLSFNERVLQEAEDPRVPLFERLNFLAIYSSNLDEFFRVRVASLRSLLRLKKKKVKKLAFSPPRLLRQIHATVARQQERFGEIFRNQILPELERQGIHLVTEASLSLRHGEYLRAYFDEHVRPHLQPLRLEAGGDVPFLEDRHVYLVAELWPVESISLAAEKPRYAVVEVPSPPLDRFVTLPAEGDRRVVMFLDDVIRHNLPALFPGHEVGAAHAVKLSRDAELYVEDEFGGDVDIAEAVRKSLSKRETGPPCRFLYDLQAPYALVAFLKERLALEDEDLVIGGRYHNLHDLADFPRFGMKSLSWPPWPAVPHPGLDDAPSVLEAVGERDHLLHFPYHSFGAVVRFLTEAAADPEVEEIWLTVYRVSRDSEILNALLDAAEAGKKVRVFVEVQARFDEASNLRWGERLQEAGIVTLYSIPGLKVHAKLALVARREDGGRRLYAYLGTGNFNERTARFYADHGLLTADPRLTGDVETVFDYLEGRVEHPTFEHLLVAPFELRERLYELIDAEARRAREGEEAGMLIKLNNLEDAELIERLYSASRAGVDIRMVVRGICCLAAGLEGHSETIRVTSILDRYLEHARIYGFRNGGEEQVYLASADWMHRNLSRRVEVAFPVYDPELRAQLGAILGLQIADDVKARVVEPSMSNRYVEPRGDTPLRSQARIRSWVASLEPETSAASAPLGGG